MGKVARPEEIAVDRGAAASVGSEDVRTLLVQWHNGRRRRPFREAVDLMEVHDFGDSPLEAEPSLLWYLQELVQAGETPTSRHHGWVQVAGVPVGDRSVHEHYCIARVLEYAIEVDQLNVATLVAFEALGRRLQLIEQAHAYRGRTPTTAAPRTSWVGGPVVAGRS